MGANTMAQEMNTQAMQDSLLQVTNDTAYWKSLELGEVVVKSSLPKTRVKGDAMRTLVSGSILEKAGSTTDMLNKIPSLKAEKGSGVEVFGRGAAEVYINGRKVQDLNELDRLRSEDVLHVDVIHNPGARYAASTKAVVRITMKKRQGEGLSFVENAGGMYKYGGTFTDNLDVNYRVGGLDLTASFWGGVYGHNQGNNDNDISYMVGKDYVVGSSTQKHDILWKGYSPQIQFNYVVNENHSFGAFYKWDHNTSNKGEGWFHMKNSMNGVPTEDMMSDMTSDGNNKKHIFNAYYNGKVGDLSIDLNVDGLFDKMLDWSATSEHTTFADGRPGIKSDVLNTTHNSNNFWATKLILSYPLLKGNLSAGTEYSHNGRNSLYDVTTESKVSVTGKDTDIKESSASAFVEYGRSFGNLFAQAGLRYENISTDYYDFGKLEEDASRSYGDFFPTLTLSYRTSKQFQLALSYRKDIDRPNYSNLSNAIIYINKYSYQGGNPYLKPIYTRNFTFNAAYKWLNLTTIYQHVKDDIVLSTMPFPGSSDPMISMLLPQNSEKSYSRLNIIFAMRPVIGVWHPTWSASSIFQNYKTMTIDGTMKTLNRPYVQIYWNNDFVLPHDWRINAFAQFTNKGDYATYRMTRAMLFTDFGVQKDVQTRSMGKFTFDLRCYDPFNLAKNSTTVFGIRQIDSTNPARRTLSLDITWRFNEAQKKYRGSGAGQSQKNRM